MVTPSSAGGFKVGAAARPSIVHDNGFLDAFDEVTGTGDPKYKERSPTLGDYGSLLFWEAKLEAGRKLRPDLWAGLNAYDHFLHGNGANRDFSYESFVAGDNSGRTTLSNAILHTIKQAEILCGHGQTVQITSKAFTTSQEGPFSMPYPDTENWQKAIGGHSIWISATVSCNLIQGNWTYAMAFTLHAEDRYNFNPGQEDIATSTPDAENGIFEITRLAHQYTQYATLNRQVGWIAGKTGSPMITNPGGR